MCVVSIWIIAGLLKIALADGSLSISQFIRATDGECHPVCSVNEPSAITYGVEWVAFWNTVYQPKPVFRRTTTQTPGSANSFIITQLISSDLLETAYTTGYSMHFIKNTMS